MMARLTFLLTLPLVAACNIDPTPNRPMDGPVVVLEPVGIPHQPRPTDRMLVQSGPVTVINGNTLGGTFTIRNAWSNEHGIAGATNGGACILARVNSDVPGTRRLCMRDADCEGRYNEISTRREDKYCIGHYGDVPSGSCFVKPSEASCRRGIGPGHHHPVSTPDVAKMIEYAATQPAPRTIDWMVLGCLNGPDIRNNAGVMDKPCRLRFDPVPNMVVQYSEGPTLRYP